MNSGIINIIANKNKDSQITMRKLTRLLEEKGYSVPREYRAQADLNICIGGDGAFCALCTKPRFPPSPLPESTPGIWVSFRRSTKTIWNFL